MKKEELNIGLLYISLHNLLRRKLKISRDRVISKRDFYTFLGKHFLIPKNLRIVVIKEMEERGLVKQERDGIKVLDCDLNMKDNMSIWYQKVGIF